MKSNWWCRITLAISILFGLGSIFEPRRALAAPIAMTANARHMGDISDSQVFVNYKSPLGFSAQVPEGWSRIEAANEVRFTDKVRTLTFSISPATLPPTVESIKREQAAALLKSGKGLKIESIKGFPLRAGLAIAIKYSYRGEIDLMTDKLTRVQGTRYFLYHQGKLGVIDLTIPFGTENVDQWEFISNSFHWD